MKHHDRDPIDALFHRVPLEKLQFQDRLASEERTRTWIFRSTWVGGLVAAALVATFLLLPHRAKGSFLPPDQLDAYVSGITSVAPSFSDVQLQKDEDTD
ncbi:MAG: hypothetical protein J0L75_13710 [Spirochaetes bacterium]|nr:hypothetical protein [Spirochaetota bacterium]